MSLWFGTPVDEIADTSVSKARISKAKHRKRVTRDMSTLKNSMLELAAKFDDNYNTGLIKSFMFGLNKTEIKTMTDILSRYKFRDSHATRGLLATDHVILNHGQVTWTTPELAPPLLTTTPHQREDVSALDRFNVHRCPTRRVFSGTGLDPVTKQATVRYLYHSATAAALPPEAGSLVRCPIGGYQSPQAILTPSFLSRGRHLSSDDTNLY
ncbi:uncharacterized protein TNCV_4064131 [Trichonephila clavipes]|nr:uncharacterized protein TNCV_4064131 [Trichonephila clavipes]